MKKMIKYVTALVLAAMLILSFTSCAGANPKIMSEKVTEIIDLHVDRDTEGIYAMFYPGAVDKDEYYAVSDTIFEYFPVTAGYTCKMEDWYVTFGIISKNNSSKWEGRYKVEFDGFQPWQWVTLEEHLKSRLNTYDQAVIGFFHRQSITVVKITVLKA